MNEAERLRAAVQDERARRRWAERMLAGESDRTATWRQRAEDRAARIRLLEQRLATNQKPARGPTQAFRSVLASVRNRLRKLSHQELRRQAGPETVEASSSSVPDGPRPSISRPASTVGHQAFPFVKVATLGGADLPFLQEFDTTPLHESIDALDDADLVFLTTSALAVSDQKLRKTIVDWSGLVARQPLVVWLDAPLAGDIEPIWGSADRHYRASDYRDGDKTEHCVAFDVGFDAYSRNPIGWSVAAPDHLEDIGDLRVWSYSGQAIVAATEIPESAAATIDLMATGVPVVTPRLTSVVAPLLGLSNDATSTATAEAAATNSTMLAQMSLAARRRAHRTHTSDMRASAFLDQLGISVSKPAPEVGALLITNKPDFVEAAIESILRQQSVSVVPVIGLHGELGAFDRVRDRVVRLLDGRPFHLIDFGPETTLGEALNEAAAVCSSPILAKFDDDDWYGPHYLEDAVASLRYSRADLVGKAQYFVEIEETGDTYLVNGPEEGYTDHVIGSSLVFRRRLWEDVPFAHRPSRCDSIFLRGVRAAGGRIYSTTRFEFAVRRRPDGHTWIVDPAHFAARGERVGATLADVAVDVADHLADS